MVGASIAGLIGMLECFLAKPASTTRQEVEAEADAATTFASIRKTDVSRAPVVMMLSRLRMLPDRILRRLCGLPPPPELTEVTIPQLIESGYWVVLDDDPPRRLVLGLSMWDREVEERGLTRRRFDHPTPGAVRVWALISPFAGLTRRLVIRAIAAEGSARRLG